MTTLPLKAIAGLKDPSDRTAAAMAAFGKSGAELLPTLKNLSAATEDFRARGLGIEPRVAFLSFSSYGSAKHELVDKVKTAAELTKAKAKELGITDAAGNVFKNAQDKFKQINHYIELLSGMLKDLPQRPLTRIADDLDVPLTNWKPT